MAKLLQLTLQKAIDLCMSSLRRGHANLLAAMDSMTTELKKPCNSSLNLAASGLNSYFTFSLVKVFGSNEGCAESKYWVSVVHYRRTNH